jgi:predicted metal-dependent enzyme (double-stranded beta helix superfamily)
MRETRSRVTFSPILARDGVVQSKIGGTIGAMITTIFAFLMTLLPLQTPQLPHAFPRDGAKQLIDNERVTVWEAVFERGKPTPMHQHRYDMVIVDLADASVKATRQQGTATIGNIHVGQASFVRKGLTEKQEGTSDTPRHAIMIDLKDVVVPPLANKTNYPNAFPREGSKKLLDNERVVVWDYSWTPGKPTVMHFHDKDVVVVYLGNGDLSSTTPDGQTVVNSYSFGQSKFNARDRTHSELLAKGSQRVIAVELK